MIISIACFCLFLAVVHSSEPIGIVGASQFHAQDALGQYSYGYSGGPSSKIESKTADGITRGGYSYIDANGILQSVNYVSDPINGFRVAATNLPIAPLPESVLKLASSEVLPTVNAASVEALPDVKAAPILDSSSGLNLAGTDANLNPDLKLSPGVKLAASDLQSNPDLELTPNKNFSPTDLKFTPEVKLTSVSAVIPNYKSVIATVPGLQLSAITVPALNLSPLSLSYPPLIQLSSLTPLLYPGIPILPLNDFKANLPKVEENKLDVPNLEEKKDRSKRSVLVSPLLTTFLPASSQYEVKDNIGNYAYGYQNPLSAKTEIRSLGGLTNGAYSYVDSNGLLQSVQYTADANGFRVAATNLPVA